MTEPKGDMTGMIVTMTGEPVRMGDVFWDSDGVEWHVVGGRPPHKPSSTGRIYMREGSMSGRFGDFFPHVFGCEWLRKDK